MSLIVWSEQLEVGVTIIDLQHKELVRMANELADAMRALYGQETLEKLFNGLIAYTGAHFATEERLMREYRYPEAADHRQRHADLRKTIVMLARTAGDGGLVATPESLLLLRDWLIKHIQNCDRDLARFLIAHAPVGRGLAGAIKAGSRVAGGG